MMLAVESKQSYFRNRRLYFRLFPKTHQNQNFSELKKLKNDLKLLLKTMISTQNSAERTVSFWELTPTKEGVLRFFLIILNHSLGLISSLSSSPLKLGIVIDS
jgi:hypothetical protein